MNGRNITLVLGAVGLLVTLGACARSAARGCTIVTVSQAEEVFFGCNDDYHNRDSTYWVDPGGPDKYGAIYFGDPANIQQGFNEMGLAYDANGLPRTWVTDHEGTIPVAGSYTAYPIAILRECATVAEVVSWVQTHRWHDYMHDQCHFADATGDAVVISTGDDGRVAYTRKPAGDSFLITTNFNVANRSNGDYPCWRYDLGTKRLTELLDAGRVSRDSVASVMEAVHVENLGAWTLYTLVADLSRGLVSVYFMFQYDDPVVLNVEAEIAQGSMQMQLSSLFPEATIDRALVAYEGLSAGKRFCRIIGFIWIALVALCLSITGFLVRSDRVSALSLLIVAGLGPLGLIISVLGDSGNGSSARSGAWRRSLFSAGVGIAPVVPIVVGSLLLSFFVPVIGSSSGATILLLVIAPVAVALLLVHAPILASSRSSRYLRAVVQSAAGSVASTFIALAVVIPIAAPSALWTVGQLGPGIGVALPTWFLTGTGSVVGVGILAVYHRLRQRGYDMMTPPSWWRSGLWLVLGAVLLVSGIILATQTVQWFAR